MVRHDYIPQNRSLEFIVYKSDAITNDILAYTLCQQMVSVEARCGSEETIFFFEQRTISETHTRRYKK